MRWLWVAAVVSLGLAVQPPTAPQRTFRSGIDLVQVDVSVLDRDRHPVRGLTAADFTLLEDGTPRPIVSFDAIDLPAPRAATPAWSIEEIEPDVATNTSRPGRLVVLLMDWTIRPADMPRARSIAKAAVSQLGPGDLAAVIYNVRGIPQDFTFDRSRLLSAIDRPFVGLIEGDYGNPGECYCGTCTLETMVHVADALREAPQRQKMLLFIGEDVPVWDWAQMHQHCETRVQAAREKVIEASRLANLTIHALDSRGLDALGSPAEFGTPYRNFSTPVEASRAHLDRLGNLAAYPVNTGGRSVTNTNAPADLVPALFQESASYYVLAFAPANPRGDGRVHTIDVRVNDRTLSVHARRGYFAPARRARANGTEARTESATGAASYPPTLEEGIAGLLPLTGLQVTAASAPFAVPGKDAAVIVTVGVRQPDPEPVPVLSEHVEILAAAFDSNGRRIASQVQRMDVTMPPNAAEVGYEAVLRLDLKPGAYELRIAARHRSAGRVGGVYGYVDVPDFRRDALSVSGIVLQGNGNALATPTQVFESVLPGMPTPDRHFSAAAHVTAFARVYQADRATLRQVVLHTAILNATGQAAFERTLTLPPAAFGADRAADWRFDLPLASLGAGEYLLTIDASAGDKSTRRNVRFSVT